MFQICDALLARIPVIIERQSETNLFFILNFGHLATSFKIIKNSPELSCRVVAVPLAIHHYFVQKPIFRHEHCHLGHILEMRSSLLIPFFTISQQSRRSSPIGMSKWDHGYSLPMPKLLLFIIVLWIGDIDSPVQLAENAPIRCCVSSSLIWIAIHWLPLFLFIIGLTHSEAACWP